MSARAIMVCGTTSGAGKSLLATALARCYARRGLKVAPFKAQNMSNNARVVAGGEMGSAQYFQALAARTTPEVRMNPVLLKPEHERRSQVILLGERRDDLTAMEWRSRSSHLWPVVLGCLEELRAENDLLVIEGAGSPAEINLTTSDIVNMRVAAAAHAATLLVCDIDRGGAFAHLHGTVSLLAPEHRALLRGFVLNKFRGDAALLAPGPETLERLTGLPTLGVLPMWREHGLPDEDGPDDWGTRRGAALRAEHGNPFVVAIVAYPCLSNLDEFAPLGRVPSLRMCWARDAAAVDRADLLVLPGSKHVAGDLEWLRSQPGLEAAVAAHVRADRPTLAICGGLQMLGAAIDDPHGVEGAARGLGLLPLHTEFAAMKRYRHAQHTFTTLTGFWRALGGIGFEGYEIHHGETRPIAPTPQAGHAASMRSLQPVLARAGGWQCGETLALYPHGLFENGAVLRALFGQAVPTLDDTLERLADFVEHHLGAATLDALLG